MLNGEFTKRLARKLIFTDSIRLHFADDAHLQQFGFDDMDIKGTELATVSNSS